MDNKVKIIIGIVAVILVITICAITFGEKKNVEEVNSNNVENSVTTNTEVENEIQNTVVENEVKNEIKNEVKKPIVEDEKLSTEDFSNSVYENNSDVGTTNKKQEAINLVKAQWGEDDTVTFSCDSITKDGIYIIAVISKERAVVVSYFRVDLATKTVTVDY